MTPIVTTLVSGGTAAQREAAIVSRLDPSLRTAVILEGLPSGNSPLAEAETKYDPGQLSILRIAPGCICCTGNLTMQVTLNRVLRTYPDRIFISLANTTHLPHIRNFLLQEPYDKWLSLTNEMTVPCRNTK